MRFIIFGACINGIRAKKILEENKHQVAAFADNNVEKQRFKLHGLQVLSFQEMVTRCSVEKFCIIIPILSVDEILEMLLEVGLSRSIKVYIAKPSFYKRYELTNMWQFEEFFCEIEHWKHRLDYLETHMADHCNLKCKGCGHLSDTAAPSFPDLSQFKDSLIRLKELFCGINTIRLLGGEPLLNKKLPDFIKCTREIFPDSIIRVVSNGLLIPHMDHELFDCMYENDAGFDISLYPPTVKVKTEIEMICLGFDIDVQFSTLVETFIKFDFLNTSSDPKLAHDKCISRHCHFLENGKIALCGAPILYAGKLLDEDKCSDDVIDLFDTELDGPDIYRKLNSPGKMCAYCNTDYIRYKWECTGQIDD